MASLQSTAINYWADSRCAKAFWGQKEVPPYQHLLAHTIAWVEPKAGDRWLDLGCGGGQLTRALWEKSEGLVAEIVGLDCAAQNDRAFRELRMNLRPAPTPEQVRFHCADFSQGLAALPTGSFAGVVSGLAIQYAEFFDAERGAWTTAAYDHLLREVSRVLTPGGSFVFSVNVPRPSWGKLAFRSWKGFFRTPHPIRFLKRSMRMMRYGAWLCREADRGRFHYLPIAKVKEKLTHAGFTSIDHRMSFAKLAYVIRCRKP